MESTGQTEGALSALPWVPVNIGGSKFLAKAWFGDTEYQLLLSDLNSVWEEQMSTNSIEQRAQVLNKRLRAPVHTFVAHLRSVAWPCLSRQSCEQSTAVHFLLKPQGGHLTVTLKSELGDVPFYWEFHCTPASVAVVSRELVCPLLSMTQVLHRQVGELTALLLKKDAEIQDYKENGAVLSRGRLLTELFEEETYRRDFNQRLSKMLPDSLEFESELQELYVSICAARTARKRKRSASVGSFVPDQDQTNCVPTGMRTASLGSNENYTRQQVEDTQYADTKETVRRLPAAAAVPPAVTTANRSVMHPKKKKAAGLFQ
ncbi:non-homologous end-joining factor 1 isoform X2 [Ictalurus furcatus]|nr:non-homologous end-joining factor 1 isoform X2 [Ictalurus furcatus]XP_053494640.1 non-homologous end-joining factor 1 isoform X2 [Ictalurus furcatus]XP_053494641.1 non-homologous end-joining factor 1 isoform X2 [Ictalurus furcatus]XP_053494642.1 non-homologous end-joining factor 1 isoform X2 [Ictalurus furcatus]XP_053494643.1 non-homologous end-joining factor 1 isoform X2 [Ictalurus furcatus]